MGDAVSDAPRPLLCKDCRFVASIGDPPGPPIPNFPWDDPNWLDLYARAAVCHHPTAREEELIDLVTGAVTVHWTSCRRHREPGSVCGPEGRWFEPKQGRE